MTIFKISVIFNFIIFRLHPSLVQRSPSQTFLGPNGLNDLRTALPRSDPIPHNIAMSDNMNLTSMSENRNISNMSDPLNFIQEFPDPMTGNDFHLADDIIDQLIHSIQRN
jgi:hypothetical protein